MKKLLIVFPLLCTLSSSPMNKTSRIANLVAGGVTGAVTESMKNDASKFASSIASFAICNYDANNLQELFIRAILFYSTHAGGYCAQKCTKEKQKKIWNEFLTWYKEKYRNQQSTDEKKS